MNNIAWILTNGLHCRNSAVVDPGFVQIGRPEIILGRKSRNVGIPPGGTLGDYIPFYFNSKTPMLYNIKTGWDGLQQRSMEEIAIIVLALREIDAMDIPFVFSDRNAALVTATFSSDLGNLATLPWEDWQNDDFRRDFKRPDKIERYHAEALIHRLVPISAVKAIGCFTEAKKVQVATAVESLRLNVQVLCRPGWYC